MKIAKLTVVRVKEVSFVPEGTYKDSKTKEDKISKKKWIVDAVFMEAYQSKLDKKTRYREMPTEAISEIEIGIGDWLVEFQTRKYEGNDEETITIKRVVSKSDFSLILPKKEKGEKT